MSWWRRSGGARVARAFQTKEEFLEFLDGVQEQLREPFFEIHKQLRDQRADYGETRSVREYVRILYDMADKEVNGR